MNSWLSGKEIVINAEQAVWNIECDIAPLVFQRIYNDVTILKRSKDHITPKMSRQTLSTTEQNPGMAIPSPPPLLLSKR